MAQDVLAVDRYVSQKIGITPFDPSQLCFKEVGDNKFWMNPHAKVVAQAGPILEKIGIEARRVGSSNLRVILFEDKDEGNEIVSRIL